jgi:putative RNA 2'-phosphotransferase
MSNVEASAPRPSVKNLETATKVRARRVKPVILKIDPGRMHRDGHKFFFSMNGVR